MSSKTYKYFVSYAYVNLHYNGFGNAIVSLSFKIKNNKDIQALQREIENRSDMSNVTLLSFQRLD